MPKFQTEKQMLAKTLLKEGDYKSIRDIIERVSRFYPDRQILAELDSEKQIVYYTAKDMLEIIMNLGDGLIARGLKDAHIAICADNSCRYILADMSISSGVGVVTPIDVEAPVELLEILLAKCEANAVICSARCLEKLKAAAEKCPLLKTFITIDKKVDGCLFYDDIVAEGEALKDNSVYRKIELDVEAPAKILFTSGTTGANKGVVLTNANLTANAINNLEVVEAEESNTSMSVLPMHHATEINCHVMTRIASGRLTYINDSMRNMMTNIKIFKPSCITIVPMIANVFYKSIWSGARKAGKAEKLEKGIKLCRLLRKFGIDKTHSMFPDVYAPFGGNLRMIVCGGAMLNPNVVKGMDDLGIRLENAYGITECGPLISMNGNPVEEYRSVGRPCPRLEVKLADMNESGVGELCVKGASISKGYYKDPEATAQVFDKEGFFHTGDNFYFDKEGRMILVGRKKNTIILGNGRNVSPEELENLIEINLEYATDVVVYQAKIHGGEDVICAGLYIKDEEKRADREAIAADIKKINQMVPDYKAINYVELPDHEYEKTGSKKIKRATLPYDCSGDGIKIL